MLEYDFNELDNDICNPLVKIYFNWRRYSIKKDPSAPQIAYALGKNIVFFGKDMAASRKICEFGLKLLTDLSNRPLVFKQIDKDNIEEEME